MEALEQKEVNTYSLGPASNSAPEQLVILLHGLGSNGRDLLGLAPVFGEALPNAIFVSPDAPFLCDMVPMGGESYQWFSLQDTSPESIMTGVLFAAPLVDELIENLMAQYNIPADKTALVGFSQGTMMSLYAGPRTKSKLAGVLGYSGALAWESDTDFNALNKIPVELIHGDADQVVSVEAYHQAKKVLEEAGFDVTGGVTEGLQHNIDEAGIVAGAEFLKRILS